MARTIQQIYDNIIADMANYEALNEINSQSATALFKLFAYVFAYAAWTLESLFDLFIADVDEKLLRPANNVRVYQQRALSYQHGDELIWLEDKQHFDYLVIDDEKQIVAQSAAIDGQGRVTIKVVKDVNGQLEPLTTAELAGLSNFMERTKDAGVFISVLSNLPDDLSVHYDFIYDPLVITSDGRLLSDNSIYPVQNAIDNYIAELDFNGRFSISKLENAIQAVPGLIDFRRYEITSRQGAADFAPINVDIVAVSGYMKLHVSSIINYIASNV